MNQEDLRNRLLIEHEAVTRDALTVAYGLSDEQLARSRQDSWSIGQLFEHLVLYSDSYFNKMRGRIFDAHAPHTLADAQVECRIRIQKEPLPAYRADQEHPGCEE